MLHCPEHILAVARIDSCQSMIKGSHPVAIVDNNRNCRCISKATSNRATRRPCGRRWSVAGDQNLQTSCVSTKQVGDPETHLLLSGTAGLDGPNSDAPSHAGCACAAQGSGPHHTRELSLLNDSFNDVIGTTGQTPCTRHHWGINHCIACQTDSSAANICNCNAAGA